MNFKKLFTEKVPKQTASDKQTASELAEDGISLFRSAILKMKKVQI